METMAPSSTLRTKNKSKHMTNEWLYS